MVVGEVPVAVPVVAPEPVVVVTEVLPELGPLSSRICSPTIPRITARPTTTAPRTPAEAPDDRDGPPPPLGAVTESPDPRAAFEALTPASVAFAADPLHGEGIVVVGLGHVDEVPEDLVVPGRGDPELGADRRLLGSGAAPPAPLEVEDGTITTREAHQARDPRRTGPAGQAFRVSDGPVCPVSPGVR